jgi:hypothetical protein
VDVVVAVTEGMSRVDGAAQWPALGPTLPWQETPAAISAGWAKRTNPAMKALTEIIPGLLVVRKYHQAP